MKSINMTIDVAVLADAFRQAADACETIFSEVCRLEDEGWARGEIVAAVVADTGFSRATVYRKVREICGPATAGRGAHGNGGPATAGRGAHGNGGKAPAELWARVLAYARKIGATADDVRCAAEGFAPAPAPAAEPAA